MILAGCAPWWPPATLLERADRLVQQGDYASAVRTYDELLAKYPDDPAARRALTSRDAVAGLLEARKELAARDGELTRLRQEVERLREDLENLKKLDLRDERRRRQ
jgi:predicted Zn-dependent protease